MSYLPENKCPCACHRGQNVKHFVACCTQPRFGDALEKLEGTMTTPAPPFTAENVARLEADFRGLFLHYHSSRQVRREHIAARLNAMVAEVVSIIGDDTEFFLHPDVDSDQDNKLPLTLGVSTRDSAGSKGYFYVERGGKPVRLVELPEGFALVPLVPTEKMVDAGLEETSLSIVEVYPDGSPKGRRTSIDSNEVRRIIKAAIDAARGGQ